MAPPRLGSFRVETLLARGGMGEVWRGEHVGQGTPVAIKIVTAHAASDPVAMERFRAEVRAVARLHHRGIVLVLDQGEAPGAPYLVMELADGTLGRAWTPASFGELRHLLVDMLGALAHAHAHDVVHRDIKPGNVLVVRRGGAVSFKLADFGLAHALDSSTPIDRDIVSGTPRYMAPEQIQGQWRDQGPWTDLYAVGCIAYRFACGRTPYNGRASEILAAHLLGTPPPFEPLYPVPAELDGWVRWLLEKSSARRCSHAADALAALEAMPAVAGAPLRPSAQRPHAPWDATEPTLAQPEPHIVAATPPVAPIEPVRVEKVRRPPPSFERVTALAPPRPTAALVGAGLGLYGLRPVPLVGRLAEREALWEALERVHATRRPAAVMLRGAAGTGKSRVAEWLARTAAEVGAATPLRVTHGPIPGPSHGLDPAVSAHFRCAGLEAPQAAGRVRELLASCGATEAELEDEVEAVTEIVCPATEGEARVRFQTEAERHLALRRLFLRLASDRPVVVWIEDVEWGADALRAASALTAGEGELPVLFVLTARDELLDDRPAEAKVLREMRACGALRVVDVEPLPEADHTELVRQMLGLEGALAGDVATRTMGNPLFAVQLVGEWVQRGALVATPEGFRVAPHEQAIVPDDIHALWTSRVERLLEDVESEARDAVRKSLEIAAALGLHVDAHEWKEACAHVAASIRAGVVEAMVARRLAVDEPGGWSFSHEMLRESLDRSARDAGRAHAHHLACAAMLETVYGSGRRGISERLARHRLAAGDLDAAAGDFLRAAHERGDAGDYSSARGLFAERDALLGRLGAPDDDERWASGWREQARACAQQGDLALGEEVGRKLADWARARKRADLLADAECSLAAMAHRRGAIDEALAYARDAVDHARRAGDGGIVSRALLAWGQVHARRGELDVAESAYREAIAHVDRGGDARLQANARYLLGTLLVLRGLDEEGARAMLEARYRFEKLGARNQAALCDGDLGEVARHRGDLDRAEEYYRRALRVLERLGSSDAWVAHINLGFVQLARGRFDEARDVLDKCLRGLEAAGHATYLVYVHAALLPCFARAGDWAAWDAHAAAARDKLGAMSLVQDDLGTCFELGATLAAEAGERDRAAEAYALARAQWEALGKPEAVERVDQALDALTGRGTPSGGTRTER